MKHKNIIVAVGMSGGVDSSVAAALLKSQGYSVIGMSMAIYSGNDSAKIVKAHGCYGPGEQDDIRQAKKVGEFLGIPHYTVDLREEFRKTVLEYFKNEYLRGRTPNPCTRCNPRIKFGFMLSKARKAGVLFDMFATGHYARICYDEKKKRYILKRAIDKRKDQSYFLYGLDLGLLSRLIFPLGDLKKEEVRRHAEKIHLPVSKRPESQDFMKGVDYIRIFNNQQIKPGPIVDTTGNQVGTHKGIINYTIGQRRGLGIAHHEPLYVLRIDAKNNTIIVGSKKNLFSSSLIADHINFLFPNRPEVSVRIKAKIRHNHIADQAELILLDDGRAKVVFDSPQLAITPGQSIVFYQDDVVLGGGIIRQGL